MLFGLFKPYRRGVAAVIVNGDGLLWIGLRHNAPNGANSGFWQFPQGGLNARDEPVEDAARREVREETGMTSLETLKIGDFTTRYRFPKEAVAERRLARRYRGQNTAGRFSVSPDRMAKSTWPPAIWSSATGAGHRPETPSPSHGM